MSAFGEIGGQAVRDLAAGIIAATPEAQIAAAEAAGAITSEMARTMREHVRSQEDITRLVESIGDAAISELEKQHTRVVEAAEGWVDQITSSISDMWSAIDDPRSIAAAEEALDDQQRTVREAQERLDEARTAAGSVGSLSQRLADAKRRQAKASEMGADGEAFEIGEEIAELERALEEAKRAASDVAGLEEALSDAKTGAEADALRLLKMLLESGSGVTTGANGSVDMVALGAAAGLSEDQVLALGRQYSSLGAAESNAEALARIMPSQQQMADAIAAAIAQAAGPTVNVGMLAPTPEAMAALRKLLDDWWKNRGLGA